MLPLSELLDESLTVELRRAVERQEFPGIPFDVAMEFVLSDGIVPASGLPVSSLLRLDDWVRERARARAAGAGAAQG